MYVYGNGKWHTVKTKEVHASTEFLHTHCGITFTGENTTSDDTSVMSSAHYCTPCMKAVQEQEQDNRPGSGA